MKKHLTFILVFLSIVYLSNAQTWTPSGGPYGGYVLCMAIHPTNDNIVYCGTKGGDIYKTTNGGELWSRLENLKSDIRSIAMDPTNTNILFAGTKSNSIYKSTNAGVTWTNINLSSKPINAIVIDKNNTSILYVGVYDSGISKSTDAGLNWLPINVGINSKYIYSLAIDPSNSQTLYCGVYEWPLAKIYKSTTGGLTWLDISPFFFNTFYIRALCIDPISPNILYAGTNDGLIKSTNAGNTWGKYDSGITSSDIYSIGIDPGNPSTVYTGTNNGLFKTFTGGSSWTSNFTIPPYCTVETIAVSLLNPNVVYIGFKGEGIYKTTNGGTNWIEINSGFSNLIVRKIVSHPGNPNILFAGTEIGGIYRTTTGGISWENVKQRIFDVYALAFDPVNPNKIYAGTYGDGLYKSIDGGSNWSLINTGLSNKKVWSIAVDPFNQAIVYSATDGGVFKSADGGLQWVKTNYPSYYGSYSVLINPTNSSILYVGSYEKVLQSSNAGSSWSELAANLSNNYIMSLTFKQASPNIIYYGGGDISSWDGTIYGGIYRMALGGTIWYKLVDKAYSTEIVINPSVSSEIYSSTRNEGIYCSRNSGDNWFKINNGLPTLTVDGLCISGNSVYAAVRNGSIWKTSTVTDMNENDNAIPVNYYLSQNYPNPFNPSTRIFYQIPQSGFVVLKVYDLLGREVSTLAKEYKNAGKYEIEFNASNLTSGVYFYRLQAGDPSLRSGQGFSETKKLILLK